MNSTPSSSCPLLDAVALREAGRVLVTPFAVALGGGEQLQVSRLLRILPGKRVVGEGRWRGRAVLVKLFVADGSARHWAKEKNGIVALTRFAIDTPSLLLSEPLPGSGHVLLTDYLTHSQSLAEAWSELADLPPGNTAALAVLCPAFSLLGRLHAGGLVQDDLHLGNFLRSTQGTERFWVIDGDAVRAVSPGAPLDEGRSLANLAILLAQLPPAWDAHQPLLLAAYRDGGASPIANLTALCGAVDRVRAQRLGDYLGKALRDCTLFAVERGVFRFSAVVRAEREALSPVLEQLDASVAQGRLLKDGRTCTVACVEAPQCTLAVKRYNLKSAGHALGRCWRPSRAWHSWREGHRLRFLGIPTPAPLALVEERFGPLRRRAFLVNEYCPGIDLLSLLVPEHEPEVAVGEALLASLGALHQARISHGDFKASNLLWHDGRVFIIDLDAVEQHRTARAYAPAWRRDRARLLRNWPADSPLHRWLDAHLPAAA